MAVDVDLVLIHPTFSSYFWPAFDTHTGLTNIRTSITGSMEWQKRALQSFSDCIWHRPCCLAKMEHSSRFTFRAGFRDSEFLINQFSRDLCSVLFRRSQRSSQLSGCRK